MNVITSIVSGTPSANFLFVFFLLTLFSRINYHCSFGLSFHSIDREWAREDKTVRVLGCVRGYVFVSV